MRVMGSPPDGAWPAWEPACHTTPVSVGIEFQTAPRGSLVFRTPYLCAIRLVPAVGGAVGQTIAYQSLNGCGVIPRIWANVSAATAPPEAPAVISHATLPATPSAAASAQRCAHVVSPSSAKKPGVQAGRGRASHVGEGL